MRPRTLDEVIGQRHLTAEGTPLRKLADHDAPMSLLFWGPPGTGKTTLAHVISLATSRDFVELSAVIAGVKDVRAAIDAARRRLGLTGQQTLLFIDEVHPGSTRRSRTRCSRGGEPGGVVHRRYPRRTRSSRWSGRCFPGRCCSPSSPQRRGHRRRQMTGSDRRTRPGQGRDAAGQGHGAPGPAGRLRRFMGTDLPEAAACSAWPGRRHRRRDGGKGGDRAAVRYDRDGDRDYDDQRVHRKSIRAATPPRCTTWPG